MSKKHFRSNNIIENDSESGTEEPTTTERNLKSHFTLDDQLMDSSISSSPPKQRRLKTHTKWALEELDIIRAEFSSFMNGKKLPGWKEIDKLKSDHAPLFDSRAREQIKARFVHMKKTGH